jgi:hypothetical protein
MAGQRQRDEACQRLLIDVQGGSDQLARGETQSSDKVSGRQLAARAKSSRPLDTSVRIVPSLAGSVGEAEDPTWTLLLNVPVEIDA